MQTMRAIEIEKAGADFVLVEREIPQPGPDEILIKVEACGVCHSDSFVKEGTFPGIEYPRIPGHEVIGRVVKCGKNITLWTKDQRVGIGWHGGHCLECEACRRGEFIHCRNAKVTGIHFDGGYAEYLVASAEAIVKIPEELKSIEAAPLLCAGVTTFNALRNSSATPGSVVAVLGIGGLGHLAIQYANKLGYKVVAISQGNKKKRLAKNLGAHHYINSKKKSVTEELQKLGGANVILVTAPNSRAMSAAIDGLNIKGTMIIIGVTNDPIKVSPSQLVSGQKSIKGWPSGDAKASEDTLSFSSLQDIRPKIETYPLERASEAYQQMITNKALFRAVLTVENQPNIPER